MSNKASTGDLRQMAHPSAHLVSSKYVRLHALTSFGGPEQSFAKAGQFKNISKRLPSKHSLTGSKHEPFHACLKSASRYLAQNHDVHLNLPKHASSLHFSNKAFVGFTAGTGRSWAKHDVLSWYWCHNDGGSPEEEGAVVLCVIGDDRSSGEIE